MEDSGNSSALMISLPVPITSPRKRAEEEEEEVFYDPIYHGSAGISLCTSSFTCPPHPSQHYLFSSKSSCRQRPPTFYADDFSIYEYVHVRNPRLLMDAAGPIDSCSAPLCSTSLPNDSAPNSTASANPSSDSTRSWPDSASNPPISASNSPGSLSLGLRSSTCLANPTAWDQCLTANSTASTKSTVLAGPKSNNVLRSDPTGSANSACDSK